MATLGYHSKIFIDENTLSAQTSGFTWTFNTPPIEYKVLGTNSILKIPNIGTAELEHNGYYSQHSAGYMSKEMADYLSAYTGYVATMQGSVAPQVGIILIKHLMGH